MTDIHEQYRQTSMALTPRELYTERITTLAEEIRQLNRHNRLVVLLELSAIALAVGCVVVYTMWSNVAALVVALLFIAAYVAIRWRDSRNSRMAEEKENLRNVYQKELNYLDGKPASLTQFAELRDRVIMVNGFSKSYAMTGFRVGYIAGPHELVAPMIKIHQYCIMCAPSTSQLAVVEAAMNADNEIKKMRDEYNHRRRVIVQGLKDAGLDCFTPYGAFYAFPCIKSTGLSSEEFCERFLLEKHVAIVPGNAFGKCGEGFVRISYAASLEDIKEAMKLLKEFVEELKKG